MSYQADVSEMLTRVIPESLARWDAGRKRSQVKGNRRMGMSELGSCREKLRATIAGDEGVPETGLKWAAFCGTALGDAVETALAGTIGAKVQRWVTVRLENGITVSGSTDAVIYDDHLVDFKTKAYLEGVQKDGPTRQQWIQVSGYFVGLVQELQMTTEGTASLVFLDRSGSDPKPVVFTIDYDEALGWLDAAADRLDSVADALEQGYARGDLRDEPESWCHYTQCPFRLACWGGEYEPLDRIENPEHAEAMRQYDAGRAMAKLGAAMQRAGKSVLGGFSEEPVSGENDEFTLRWKASTGRWGGNTIDLRRKG